MFFVIKEVQGKRYLYKMKSKRIKGIPAHKQVYVGPIALVLSAMPREELLEAYNGKS